MNFDLQQLRKQIEFLNNYPWREGYVPEQVEGLLYLLEAIFDKEEN